MRLNSLNVTPPGGFRYLEPSTGKWIPPQGQPADISFETNLKKVSTFLKSNSLPIPNDLSEVIQAQVCSRMSNDLQWCNDGKIATSERVNAARKGWSFTFDEVKSFTRTMIDWTLNGRERVNDETITERAAICKGCPNNTLPPGCGACSGGTLREIVAALVGGTSHPMDMHLRACSICGCDLKAKVRIPTGILTKNMSAAKQAQLPAHCWLKT